MRKLLHGLIALTLALTGIAATATPAHAACGDTAAEWVDPLLGSAWSGSIGSTNATMVFTNVANAAATVMVPNSGVGTWVKSGSFRWNATAAGIWSYTLEVSAVACAGGKVTSAQGGGTDALGIIYSVLMTRTL